MKIIDGIKIAQKIDELTINQLNKIKTKLKLVIVYLGENSASEIYINKKIRKAEEFGILTELIHIKSPITKNVLEIITKLNNDSETTGYIIQLPVPKNINLFNLLNNINYKKDIDGLSPYSLGLLYHSNKAPLISATALSAIECIKYASKMQNELNFNEKNYLIGKKILIINNSILIGKPLLALLSNLKATITIANKNTKKEYLNKLIKNNEIIITATGVPGLIESNNLEENQIIIDIGIKRITESKVVGDVNFNINILKNKNIYITPVPNGIGPITVSMLFSNLIKAYKLRHSD